MGREARRALNPEAGSTESTATGGEAAATAAEPAEHFSDRIARQAEHAALSERVAGMSSDALADGRSLKEWSGESAAWAEFRAALAEAQLLLGSPELGSALKAAKRGRAARGGSRGSGSKPGGRRADAPDCRRGDAVAV